LHSMLPTIDMSELMQEAVPSRAELRLTYSHSTSCAARR
jgi:hypothetical protein